MTSDTIPRPTRNAILLTIGILAAIVLFIYAINVFLLAFASILFAIFLNAITKLFISKSNVPYHIVLGTVLLTLALVITLTVWLYAPLITQQFQELVAQLPRAFEQLKQKTAFFFREPELLRDGLTSQFILKSDQLFQQMIAIFSGTIGTIASLIIFLFVGVYLAFNPQKYVRGFLLLFSPQKRSYVATLMNRIDHSLRWWLVGKLIVMILIGVTTYIGLTLLRIPLALILAVVAGFFTFIPYLGPIIGAIPAILIGLSQSPLKAIYVALLYIGLHTAEGYFIAPYIDQRTVFIPPALTIMVQVLAAFLMGFLGLALATPLTVVAFVLLGKLYR